MHKKLLTLTVILASYSLSGKAQPQTITYPPTPRPVSIYGRVTPVSGKRDTLVCYFQKTYWYSRYAAEKVIIVPDAEGQFNYTFPAIAKPGRLSVTIPGTRIGFEKYIMEPGDSVQLDIDQFGQETHFTITGRGSEKYRCRQAIDAQSKQWEAQWNPCKGEPHEQAFYQCRYSAGDTILRRHQQVLASYGSLIHPLVQDMIRADYTGKEKITWQCPLTIATAYGQHPQEFAFLFALAAQSPLDELAEEAMAASPDYLLYVQLKTYYKILEARRPAFFTISAIYGAHFEDMYQQIKKTYSGWLREKLLFNFLLDNFLDNSEAYAQCLQDAASWVKEEETMAQLKTLLEQRANGLPFFAFTLEDTLGRSVQLANFAGKIVVMEFWFTGCGGCAKVAAELKKEVYPIFKSNPHIAFVSVGMDVSKQQWLESVRKERYGLKEYINLFTEKKGLDHPLLKYYQINGGPRMMIIDGQGKMYSSTPPLFGRSDELITLLNEALASLQLSVK